MKLETVFGMLLLFLWALCWLVAACSIPLYRRRAGRLAKKYWALVGVGEVDGTQVATRLIAEDLAKRKLMVRPSSANREYTTTVLILLATNGVLWSTILTFPPLYSPPPQH